MFNFGVGPVGKFDLFGGFGLVAILCEGMGCSYMRIYWDVIPIYRFRLEYVPSWKRLIEIGYSIILLKCIRR